MLKPVENARSPTRLADMGVVRVQGADAIKFLQGQVSNDVTRLTAQQSVLAGLHNAQGRAIALLRLIPAAPDEVLALVPRELAAPVAARLGKFVLRAKVKISDASSEWDVAGVEVSGVAEGLAAASVGAARRDEEGRIWVCVATDGVVGSVDGDDVVGSAAGDGATVPAADGTQPASAPKPMSASEQAGSRRTGSKHAGSEHVVGSEHLSSERVGSAHTAQSRWLVVSKAAPSTEPRGDEQGGAPDTGIPASAMSRDEWLAADIAAGLPQVFAATSESFVAQMLNLDLVDGIAFDKGCYTGQEVIARAHYRGKVKRRMQRFRTIGPTKLDAGDSGTLSDGRSFKVVTAVQLSDGRSEFLAVAPVTTSSGTDDEAHGAQVAATPVLEAEALALPYSLPA